MTQVFFTVCHSGAADFIFQEAFNQTAVTRIFRSHRFLMADMGCRTARVIKDGAKTCCPSKQPTVMKLFSRADRKNQLLPGGFVKDQDKTGSGGIVKNIGKAYMLFLSRGLAQEFPGVRIIFIGGKVDAGLAFLRMLG